MIQQFAIKVQTIITWSKLGNTAITESYVKGYNEDRDFLEDTHRPEKFFNSRKEAWEFVETLPVGRCGEFNKKYTYSIEASTWTHANHIGWTDVNPYEIVRVVSDKTIEIREMNAKQLPWKRDFHAGGFFGHTSNQEKQKWEINSNESAPVIKARKRKDGYFHSSAGKHQLSDEPRKFYDYNF
jgi:hypothetical protein